MPLLAEFSIEKALLPHTISFFTNYMSFLASFFIKKALLSHMSSFLLNKCPSLAQVSVRNPFCLTNISSLFTFNYMPLTNPILSQKGFVTPYETFSANYMPISWPSLHQKSVVTSYELVPADMPSMVTLLW